MTTKNCDDVQTSALINGEHKTTNDMQLQQPSDDASKEEEQQMLASLTTSQLQISNEGEETLIVKEETTTTLISTAKCEAEDPEVATAAAAKADDHLIESNLPRVQEELDKLNYANESINNLEVELDECKRQYLEAIQDTDEHLKEIEKRLGACVAKALPYYEARIKLNELKATYIRTKHSFETSQALFVAAKELKLYAEESLERIGQQTSSGGNNVANIDEINHLKTMLVDAERKVTETLQAKQRHDKEQIDAWRAYDEHMRELEQLEKKHRRAIDKSAEYYEYKANANKELKFLYDKVEGVKACLKEAKLIYQQSLNNLEAISTEIHNQRQIIRARTPTPGGATTTTITTSTSETSHLVAMSVQADNHLETGEAAAAATTAQAEDNEEEEEDEEDFDNYFKNYDKSDKTAKIPKSPTKVLSDEQIDSLDLDKNLKKYQTELKDDSATTISNSKTEKAKEEEAGTANIQSVTVPVRPQFRLASILTRHL